MSSLYVDFPPQSISSNANRDPAHHNRRGDAWLRPDRHVADSLTPITGPRADDRVRFPSHCAEKPAGATLRSQVSSSAVTLFFKMFF